MESKELIAQILLTIVNFGLTALPASSELSLALLAHLSVAADVLDVAAVPYVTFGR